ncbi:hypothetical protein SQ03_22150 [Methylobacterium platani JCM 14648]|uniref:Uncharacterized protein n=2 Tax=Methylobacterium platani TaxID=427683 RepID=A0A179RSS3_9HYPH|nr:hypothetical protein SQ03_22150 [Methylobacterium platani JCM 14648]OAS10647.1 hypothetical protein A5481_31940 [Methylobacterium platani]
MPARLSASAELAGLSGHGFNDPISLPGLEGSSCTATGRRSRGTVAPLSMDAAMIAFASTSSGPCALS